MGTQIDCNLPATATARLRILESPIRGENGQWRSLDSDVPAPVKLTRVVEPDDWQSIIIGGMVVKSPDDWTLQPGYEVWLIPHWDIGEPTTIALISLAAGLLFTAASAFLQRTPGLQNNEDDDPTYGVQGIRSLVGEGHPVPVRYGRMRAGGIILQASVEYASTVTDGGSPDAPLTIDIVSGGEGNIRDTEDGSPDPTPIRIETSVVHGFVGGENVEVIGVTGKTGANGNYYISIVSAARFDLIGTEGLDGRAYTGGGEVRLADLSGDEVVTRWATEESARWRVLLAMNSGEIEAFEPETTEINGQPLSNFGDVVVHTRVGLDSQTPIPGFLDQRLTFDSQQGEITAVESIYTTTQRVDTYIINIDFAEGLATVSDRGDVRQNWVDVQVRDRETPGGAWTNTKTYRIMGSSLRPMRFSIERRHIKHPIATDIGVTLMAVGDNDAITGRYRPTWTSITEVVDNTEPYNEIALLALEGVANEQTQGEIPNPTVIARWSKMLVGTNPVPLYSIRRAWCVRHYLTNGRVGVNEPDSAMDIPAFQAWADRDAEQVDGEDRHTFAWSLDRRVSDQQGLLEMLRGGEAELLKSEGLWTPRLTRNDLPVVDISWVTTWNFRYARTKDPEATNVIEYRLLSQDDNFAQITDTYPQQDQWPAQVRKSEAIDLRTITRRSEAARWGIRELKRRQLVDRRIEFRCDLRALRMTFWDVFRFSHAMPGWGFSGLIARGANTTTHIVLDAPVTFDAAKNYTVHVTQDTGTTEQVNVTNPGSVTVREVDLAAPLSKAPVERQAQWAIGELNGQDLSHLPYRIVDLQPNIDDGYIDVVAEEHVEEVYSDDPTPTIPPASRLPNAAGPPPPVLTFTAVVEQRINTEGISRPMVVLNWAVAAPIVAYNTYGGAYLYRRQVTAEGAGRDYARVGEVGATTYFFEDVSALDGLTYQYRIVPFSLRGRVQNITGAQEVQIGVTTPGTQLGPPPDVTGLKLEGRNPGVTTFEGADVTWEWDAPSGSPLYDETQVVTRWRVEIWENGTTQVHPRPGRPLAYTAQPRFTYWEDMNRDDALDAGTGDMSRIMEVRVWAVTASGTESANASTLTVTNDLPDMSGVTLVVQP